MAIQPQRTRSLRRKKVKTPGGVVVIHYLKRSPSIAKCGICKRSLKGLKRLRPSKLRNVPKSQRTVSRKFGGFLCSRCSRKLITEQISNKKRVPVSVGQLCIKTAGRDSGKTCAVVDIIDSNFVLIDGQTRRKRTNILHLETIEGKIDLKPKADHLLVKKEFEKLGIKIQDSKPKEHAPRPMPQRKTKKEQPKTSEKKTKK